jgi:signal transduction histidine kinase
MPNNEKRRRGNLLAVDDTPENLLLLASALKERGYLVRAAPSGEIALGAAQLDPPDLILLDINMPGMNGYQVCRRLKEQEQLKEIPVIFISALHETFDKVKAFGVGGVDYITKPFQFEEVEARIRTHLRLRRMQVALQESYDQLQQLETLRDNLIHMVVHDMRSPLMVISGLLWMLGESLEGEANEHNLETIRQANVASDMLIRMVTDLLEISRLESGEMPLERASCDLVVVAGQAMAAVRDLAPSVEVKLEGPEQAVIECDANVVRRILENLISNGMKHTPKDAALKLEVALEASDARVRVVDQGPGIPVEYQEKIFEKFGQLDTRMEPKLPSTGLGLTFCKMAVEAHGGQIGVESEEGQGSTFWFTLPGGKLG